jgi:preprotein translocase subunit SecE
MARRNEKARQENKLLRYIRLTRRELQKVRWPSREEAWALTKLVLAVTFGMAIFLGALDLFFGWLLGGIIRQEPLFFALGAVVLLALGASAVLIGRGEEV